MIIPSGQFDGWFNDKIPELLGKLSSSVYRNATARVMGERYEHGEGTARDPAKAVEWYRKAALVEKDGSVIPGDAFAMHRLGEMYRDGVGMARDEKRADVLLKCATLQGGGRSMVPKEPAFFDQFKETGPEPAAASSALLDREVALYSLPKRVFALAWSPDGSRLAVSFEDDRQITLLDTHSGKRIWSVERKLPSTAAKPVLAFSPDGNRLYIRSATASRAAPAEIVSVLSARTGAIEQTLSSAEPPKHGAAVARSVAASHDGRLYVVPGEPSNEVRSFDTTGWSATKVLDLPNVFPETGKGFVSARLALDEQRGILFWAHDGMVQPIPLKGGKPMREFQAFQLYVEAMQVNPATGELVVGGNGSFQSSRFPANDPNGEIRSYHDATATLVRAFDPISGKQTKTYLASGTGVGGVSVSPDGKFIAATKAGAYVHLWDAATGRLLASRDMGHASMGDVAFSPDGKQLCFAEGNTVHVIEIAR
jgi:DNA-binding beta-propeller fold protein YncE